MSSRRLIAVSLGMSALALAACGGQESAPAAAEKAIDPAIIAVMEARHDGFEALGDSFKGIMDAMKAGESLNADMAQAAKDIAAKADEIGSWFPEGSGPETGRKTEAKAEIWTQPEAFAKAQGDFVEAAKQLDALAVAGDAEGFAAQAKALGGTCKGCHDDFRLDDH